MIVAALKQWAAVPVVAAVVMEGLQTGTAKCRNGLSYQYQTLWVLDHVKEVHWAGATGASAGHVGSGSGIVSATSSFCKGGSGSVPLPCYSLVVQARTAA